MSDNEEYDSEKHSSRLRDKFDRDVLGSPTKKKRSMNPNSGEPSGRPEKMKSVEVKMGDGTVRQMRVKAEKEYNPLEVLFTRIPPSPLPMSWCHSISPYNENENATNVLDNPNYFESDVVHFDETLLKQRSLNCKFQAVLMDPPWIPLVPNQKPFTADMLVKCQIVNQMSNKFQESI